MKKTILTAIILFFSLNVYSALASYSDFYFSPSSPMDSSETNSLYWYNMYNEAGSDMAVYNIDTGESIFADSYYVVENTLWSDNDVGTVGSLDSLPEGNYALVYWNYYHTTYPDGMYSACFDQDYSYCVSYLGITNGFNNNGWISPFIVGAPPPPPGGIWDSIHHAEDLMASTTGFDIGGLTGYGEGFIKIIGGGLLVVADKFKYWLFILFILAVMTLAGATAIAKTKP
jgi:hypothetical protein